MTSLPYPTQPVSVTATTALPTPVDATTVLPTPAISAAPALPSAVQPAKVFQLTLLFQSLLPSRGVHLKGSYVYLKAHLNGFDFCLTFIQPVLNELSQRKRVTMHFFSLSKVVMV